MSTATAEEQIELVSPHASLWVSLETNHDEYDTRYGLRTVARGRRVKFARGRASCPASWKADLEQHPGCGKDFFFAADVTRPIRGQFGPEVISGQVRGTAPEADAPPLPDWDKTGARGIRQAIDAGKVSDLHAAMAWETRPNGGKARAQVIEAIGKALRAGAGDESEEEGDELTTEDDNAGEGFVRPLPESAGGI